MAKWKHPALSDPLHDPAKALFWLRARLRCASDNQLAKKLRTDRFTISKIRAKKIAIPDSLLIAIHEETKMKTKDIKTVIGYNKYYG